MEHTSFTVDVTDAVPIDGPHHVSGWVFAPERPAPGTPFLYCIPGATYTRAYWHLEVPGREGYSFAEYFADRGMLVVAIDNLGTGESSHHPRAAELMPEVVAAANAAAVEEVRARIAKGSLADGLDAFDVGPVIGVGHSMGSMLLIAQQALFGTFDAIAPLGYGVTGPIMGFVPGPGVKAVGLPPREEILAAAAQGAFDEMPPLDRALPELRRHFYWDDVPDDVIAADDLTTTNLPGVCGLMAGVPFVVTDLAGRVTCPVFIGLGERDSTSDHHQEAHAYWSSNDITVFLLPSSAHNHNSASTRFRMWDRLARWIESLDPEVTSGREVAEADRSASRVTASRGSFLALGRRAS